MEFALHTEAIEDLDEIHKYIGNFNSGAADRVLEEIFMLVIYFQECRIWVSGDPTLHHVHFASWWYEVI